MFGLIHYNAPGATLDEFLEYAADTGFECVELQCTDVWPKGEEHPEKLAEAARSLLDKHGLVASALSAHNDFNVLGADEVEFQVSRMRRIVSLAGIIGAKVIRTEGGQPKETVPESRIVEAISGCLKRSLESAQPAGVGLAVDNHGVITNNGDLLHAVLTEVNHPLVGTNMDTMNYRWFGNDLETCGRYYEMMAPFTLHTHLKDGFGARENYVGAALGEGEIDLARALKALKSAGYKGHWVAEYEGREDSSVGYRKCLEWMRGNV